MKKRKSSVLGGSISVLCLSGWGSVILLLIGKFVGIMFIAFVGALLGYRVGRCVCKTCPDYQYGERLVYFPLESGILVGLDAR